MTHQPTSYPLLNRLPVILLLCLVYLCLWNWAGFAFVMQNGELVGPDDFLRMSQVHAFMNGQGWFDLTAYQMVPPIGGDIHWSRLVDVPIAALVSLFGFFMDFKQASYLAAIVWPLLLMLSTITVWTFICDRLLGTYARWLPALFGVLTISSINQFSVGRVDHHNLQILCFGLMILGLVNRDRNWGNYLIGFAAAFSMSIGAETLVVILLVFAIIGLEWALAADHNARSIVRVGLSLILSTLVLYVLNFAPEEYFTVAYDANSFFFLVAFILIGIGFCCLGFLSTRLALETPFKTTVARGLTGVVVAFTILGCLALSFPDFWGDPFSNMSEEAKVRWLDYVSEAKSLAVVLDDFPFHWLATVGYYVFILIIGLVVLANHKYRTVKILSLYLILLACVLGMIWQVRVVRTAAFLVVPFCTIFSTMCWEFLKWKYENEKLFLYIFQSGIVMFQISIFWYIVGALFFPPEPQASNASAIQASNSSVLTTIRREPDHCLAEFDFEFLQTLPKTNFVSDLTTSTALMFHTHHNIVSGPYHRNERAILDTLDFMGRDEKKALAVAEKYQLSHLAFCTGKNASLERDYEAGSVTDQLKNDRVPVWLNEVSPKGSRIRVFKIRLD